ncbi:MAG: nitroreductase [Syntrophomonadaceae bacterium]|jgi:5,6-dimethylbenzimidazole synthase|nr:nitroreductase [Syntrophomonadaceae bacterium]
MDIFTAIKGRRSFRNYLSTPVEEEKLKAILEAGRWAPSVMNLQPWNFLVVKNQDIKTRLKASCQETLDKIYAASGWKWVSRFKLDFLTEAPVIIVVAGDPKKTGADQFLPGRGTGYAFSCCAAIQNMHLAAHALGLGSLWFTLFETDKIKAILNLPDELDVVGMVVLGYPASPEASINRKPLEEMVTFID